VRILAASTKAERRYSFDQHMLMIYVFLVIVSVLLASVGGMGLITTVSMNVTERRRELGVLRALGATPARVIRLVVFEGALIGVTAWFVATIAAVPLTKLIGDFFLRRVLASGAEIVVALEPRGVALWFGVSLLGSVVASLWPARQASRTTVHEALAHE
jgi:putative ABC transport system permease protein